MLTLYEVRKLARSKQDKHEHLYVMFDGACRDDAFGLLFSLGGVEDYQSLYLGTRYMSVLEYGPFLVKVRPVSAFFQWFFKEGPQDYAGAFFFSHNSLVELHENFKDFMEVAMPDGSKSLLRFYDPRITRRALALMTQEEKACFFRGIDSYYLSKRKPWGATYWIDILQGEHAHG